MTELSGKDQALVEGAGFEKASDLEAALNQQTRIYKQLPDMAAPKDESERDTLSRVLSKLKLLVTDVVKLEGSIDAYVRQHEG
jgi:hypothetical protein